MYMSFLSWKLERFTLYVINPPPEILSHPTNASLARSDKDNCTRSNKSRTLCMEHMLTIRNQNLEERGSSCLFKVSSLEDFV